MANPAKDAETTETHPSFGMVGISHVSSTGSYLVGSEFKHQHFVTLTIRRASKYRTLSREWWHGREVIAEVHLSEAQLVEMIGRPNMGGGVVCTLDYVNGEKQPAPPAPVSEAKKFRADMKADAERCVAELKEAHAELVAAIDSGKIGKPNLREIAQKIEYAGRAVSGGIPFVQASFDEKIEQTIHHAAAEIEATVANMAMRLGVERIRELSESGPKLLEESKGDQP